MLESINRSAFNWNFNADDWLVDLILSNNKLRHKILVLKNYSATKINNIIYEAFNLVKAHREKLESNSKEFLKKKQYLVMASKNNEDYKIQISLEDEYRLKELIEQYKLYELIGWFHLGKNFKVFKHCTLKKQEILEKIYPIVDLSIRKVIGAKVISPKDDIFEEAVNNAWLAIIKYLPKIDTSKVMFSIFVGIGHRSAIYYNVLNLREKYKTVRINDINSVSDEDGVSEELFINTVIRNNNEDVGDDIEDDILNEIDSIDVEENFFIETIDNMETEIEQIIESIENDNHVNYFHQNVLAKSFNILSGKTKKICFEKIFAEFFNDVINSKIPEKILNKHSPAVIEIMNLTNVDESIINNEEANNTIYKLFRDWIKDKIDSKLHKYGINVKDEIIMQTKKQQILEIIKRENLMLKYIKDNKNDFIKELLKFKNDRSRPLL